MHDQHKIYYFPLTENEFCFLAKAKEILSMSLFPHSHKRPPCLLFFMPIYSKLLFLSQFVSFFLVCDGMQTLTPCSRCHFKDGTFKACCQ